MKQIIAYGENGKNKIFETQGECMAFFEISNNTHMQRHLFKGSPVEDPDTQEKYYLDELESDYGDAI